MSATGTAALVLAIARDAETIALAADQRTSGGGGVITDDSSKVWRRRVQDEDWLFAGTIQVVQYQFSPPYANEGDLLAYMIGQFVPALSEVLQRANLEHKSNDVATVNQASFVVARRGRIFQIYNDYSVVEQVGDCWAAGSGGRYALGAMHATEATDARSVAVAGVEAAIRYDLYCGGKPQVELLKITP